MFELAQGGMTSNVSSQFGFKTILPAHDRLSCDTCANDCKFCFTIIQERRKNFF